MEVISAFSFFCVLFSQDCKAKAIIKSVSTLFAVGNRYSRKLVKDKLNRFYKDNNIKRTAKHTDIYEYFNLTEVTVRGERYIEILNRK